jgi:hypothetical protein
MQPITFIFACVALFIACLSPVQAIEGYGQASVMGAEYTNSTQSLDKRSNRGTW